MSDSSTNGFKIITEDLISDDVKLDFRNITDEVVLKLGSCNQPHRKGHFVFLEMLPMTRVATIDLCDLFSWCKFSRISKKNSFSLDSQIKAGVMETIFTNAMIVTVVSDECRIFIGNGANTVQIKVIRKKQSVESAVACVRIHTRHNCMECNMRHSFNILA